MVSDSLREDVGREHDSCVHRTLFEPSSCGQETERHVACRLQSVYIEREHLHHTDPLCTHSALLGGIMYSAPALCILYDSFFGLSYLYWASFCILHLHPALPHWYSVRSLHWLWVSFCIPHPASCILHVSHRSCRSSF